MVYRKAAYSSDRDHDVINSLFVNSGAGAPLASKAR